MLARVASNLFWMGRYIERTEHIARFMNVNYFSSLDAPNQLSQSRQFVLRSMLRMVGVDVDETTQLNEEEVLYDIGLNPEKNFSILYNITVARENANSARDLISTEIYEAINKFYHYVKNYPKDTLVTMGLYDFTTSVTDYCSIARNEIRSTLLHDEAYSLILLGINIERATQINRVIETKYQDAKLATGGYSNPINNSFEWTTLLKCCESYDMMRRFYKKPPNSMNTLEFLILNPDSPRSIMNSLNEASRHINDLDSEKIRNKESAAFLMGKMQSLYKFRRIDDIEFDAVEAFISKTLNDLVAIGEKLEKEYFNY